MMYKAQNRMQESVANILRLELMDKCNCGSGQEVLFICKSNQCADHQKQKYYCIKCSQIEGKHEHKSIVIVSEIEAQSKKWHEFKLQLQTTYDEATKRYREFEPLIKYIEEAMMEPPAKFAKQAQQISVRYGQVEKVYMEGS